jgi:hypothetical protein
MLEAICNVKWTYLGLIPIPRMYLPKGDNLGYDGNKKVNGIKISAVTEDNDLSIAFIHILCQYTWF